MSTALQHTGYDPPEPFVAGEEVVAVGSYMHQLTEGKRYTVQAFTPAHRCGRFTWTAAVTVIGDFGTKVTGHYYRFRKVPV